MRKKKINTDKIKINKFLFVMVFFLFAIFIGRLAFLCLVDYRVEDSTISAFIDDRNINEEVLMPIRGSIFDRSGNVLAQSVSSYTVIAYLSDTRSEGSDTPLHVVNKEMTAEKLAPLINMSESEILELLNKDAYQVELGPGGRNLSQIQMEAIKELNLPGIDFTESTKRYYPNGDFASYLLGYTVNKEGDDGNSYITGEMGVEEYFNDLLSGTSGYVTYEKDRYGYKIANGREFREEADDGDDIYLTIDNNIELFIENAVKKASSDSEAEWTLMIVADAKTGAILGYSSTPSYDPNLRNMTSYVDPIVGNPYEPGSTMKIFSYMCAIDSGNYDGSTKYTSGSKTYESTNEEDDVTINDWLKEGWGDITYDEGFALSSNIAVANIVENVIDGDDLKACYDNYGFGSKTGFTVPREQTGSVSFKYQVEVATAGYGQGITTTPIQHIQALTAIANDGMMLKPYIVSKIIDPDTGKETYTGSKEEVRSIASSSTISKLKELMRSVVQPDSEKTTGYPYYMEGYDLIGKTGTAQIFDYSSNQYLTGESDYIYSFSGIYPGENPEIIIYTAMKKPKDKTNYLATAVKDVITNISNYLNIDESTTKEIKYEMGEYLNKNINTVREDLTSKGLNVIVLGDGDKITNQYPYKDTTLVKGDLVVLLTNSYDKKMIDLVGMSYKDAKNILELMGVNYELKGNGYVTEQSILKDTIVKDSDLVVVTLQEKYKDDVST